GSAPPANLRIMQEDFTIDGSPAGQPKSHQTDAPAAIEGESQSKTTPNQQAQDRTHRKPTDDDVDGDETDDPR
ncbi:hypothetical protein, partial [Salinicola sp.]